MDDASLLTLARIETPVLEALWRTLGALPPKARVTEQHLGTGALAAQLEPVLGQPAWLVGALLEAVLAERGSFSPLVDPGAIAQNEGSRVRAIEYRIERHYGTTSPELVWSGSTGARSCARATRYVIEDLFAVARHDVLIAGYSFDHASDLFEPLFARAAELAADGQPPPRVRVVLDCSRVGVRAGEAEHDLARRAELEFRRTCWRSDELAATVQYWRPSTERTSSGFAPHSMHAKCIVVDREKALVGSANFSNRGRDKNLEVGALVRDHHFVQSLAAAWEDVRGELGELDPFP